MGATLSLRVPRTTPSVLRVTITEAKGAPSFDNIGVFDLGQFGGADAVAAGSSPL